MKPSRVATSNTPRVNSVDRDRTPATPREPASQAGSIVPHSAAQLERSNNYHKNVVDADSRIRAVAKLNPTKISKEIRTFPGLAN